MAESKKLASICCPCFTDYFLFPVVSFLLELEKHKPYAPDHTTTPMNTLRPYPLHLGTGPQGGLRHLSLPAVTPPPVLVQTKYGNEDAGLSWLLRDGKVGQLQPSGFSTEQRK